MSLQDANYAESSPNLQVHAQRHCSQQLQGASDEINAHALGVVPAPMRLHPPLIPEKGVSDPLVASPELSLLHWSQQGFSLGWDTIPFPPETPLSAPSHPEDNHDFHHFSGCKWSTFCLEGFGAIKGASVPGALPDSATPREVLS